VLAWGLVPPRPSPCTFLPGMIREEKGQNGRADKPCLMPVRNLPLSSPDYALHPVVTEGGCIYKTYTHAREAVYTLGTVTARKLKTYRVDEDLVKAVSAQARTRGETVTDVIERAFRAYIQQEAPERGVYTVQAGPVYTPPEPAPDPIAALRAQMAGFGVPLTTASQMVPPPEVVEDAIVPVERQCRHPSASVIDGVCRECGRDVWLRWGP
jgi:hypothetical protein